MHKEAKWCVWCVMRVFACWRLVLVSHEVGKYIEFQCGYRETPVSEHLMEHKEQ